MREFLTAPIAVFIGVRRALRELVVVLKPQQLVLCDLPTEHLYWIDPKRKVLRIASVDPDGRFDPTADDDYTMDAGFGDSPIDLAGRDRQIWKLLAERSHDRKALRKLRKSGRGNKKLPFHWSEGPPRVDANNLYLVRLGVGDQPIPDARLARSR